MLTVHKVVAYVVAADKLLVLVHPHHPEAGLQVPAGTIETGESADMAVLRELGEETGLIDFGKPECLGDASFDMTAFGRCEIHHRHFFRVPFNGNTPARWQHTETSDGNAQPELFELFWVSLSSHPDLIAEQGAFLHALPRAA
jgi:8-oxo-dGTP diphosphatase